MRNMRSVTISMICGIVIGMVITNLSQNFAINVPSAGKKSVDIPPVATAVTRVEEPNPFVDRIMAPGLQIVEVPPPLDIDGHIPYQCYFNGEVVQLPKEMVKKFLDDNGIENSPDVNIHDFIGNLEYIDLPVGTQLPPRQSSVGRTR